MILMKNVLTIEPVSNTSALILAKLNGLVEEELFVKPWHTDQCANVQANGVVIHTLNVSNVGFKFQQVIRKYIFIILIFSLHGTFFSYL